MHGQALFTLLLALLLVGTGFVLGQYYAINRGIPKLNSLSFFSSSQPLDRLEVQEQNMAEEAQGFSSLSASVLEKDEQEEERLLVPDELVDLRLSRLVEGEEALAEGLSFMGDSEAIKNITIPYYVGGNSQVTVWIVETYSSGEAAQLLEKMDCRLRDSDVFYNHETLIFDDFLVYGIEGLNMNNYYYRKNNLVFWISIISEEPEELLSKLFPYF